MVSGEGRDDSLSGFGKAGHGGWLFARFFNGVTCRGLSADVAQRGYFGSGDGPVSWGRCPAGGVVEKIDKKKKMLFYRFL